LDTPSNDFEELLAAFNANDVKAIIVEERQPVNYLGRAEFLRNKRASGHLLTRVLREGAAAIVASTG
jgi:hypothetical protein